MTFASRKQAGQLLGRHLLDRKVQADLVAGLPRGGVVVAAAVAEVLGLPLDVLLVRKIGHPRNREFAVGALAEGNVVMLNEAAIGSDPLVRMELEGIIAEETGRLYSYGNKFRRGERITLADQRVLLVDDGLATGATMRAAVRSAHRQDARRIIVAVPVASTSAVDCLSGMADHVIALLVDKDLQAVGRYYEHFEQTTDEEVLALLAAGR